MTVRIGSSALNDAINRIISNPSGLTLYTGAQPETGDSAPTGNSICMFDDLNFMVSPDNTLHLDPGMGTLTVTSPSGGTAGYGRLSFSNTTWGTIIIDGSVGISGSGATFIISSTDIAVGEAITISSIDITLPG